MTTRKPKAHHYRFKLHRELSIPAAERSTDFVVAFSVFTHLPHSESYLYLEDIWRVLKPGGKCVFSFLEFVQPNHWSAFMQEVETRRGSTTMPAVLNTFIERRAVEQWASHLGFGVEDFTDATSAPWGGAALGQTLGILVR